MNRLILASMVLTSLCFLLSACGGGGDGPPCTSSADCSSAFLRSECHNASCVQIQNCGYELPCLNSIYTLCDAAADRCYALNGQCESLAECPHLDIGAASELVCAQGFCRVFPPALQQVPGLIEGQQVAVQTPLAGQKIDEGLDFTISWTPSAQGDPALVYILDSQPLGPDDVAKHAIWAAAIPSGAPPSIKLSQGHSVGRDGTWGGLSPLPTALPLFLLAELVRADRLVGSSVPVPFSIGGAWAQPGSACTNLGSPVAVPGPCYSPSILQACINEACAVVCGSHLDCAALGLRCGAIVNRLRVCS